MTIDRNQGEKMRIEHLITEMFFLMVILTAPSLQAETYSDSLFAFRVELKDNWALDQANDSEYYFKDTAAGKKTRLHLKKYTLDTSYNFDTQEWSQLSFAVNKGIAEQTGKVVFSDTSSSKRLGDLHAYELFAYFSQMVNNKTVWWAEYSRWADTDGIGFFVSIIGDTTEIKPNFTSYKSMVDLVAVHPPVLHLINHTRGSRYALKVITPDKNPGWIDLMGRKTLISHSRNNSGIILNKNTRQFRIQLNCIQ
jgi:hypothetical protein